jgi:alkanesulfonate monooxygenase SsuD/methylene tetrahydromethanopterin reductase-like flavin-dependent oxidoreductase (luciferase family)
LYTSTTHWYIKQARTTTDAGFKSEADHGSLYVGSPETVARRITATVKALGLSRFDMKYSAGSLSHEKIMGCIALFGEKVMPMVREMVREMVA